MTHGLYQVMRWLNEYDVILDAILLKPVSEISYYGLLPLLAWLLSSHPSMFE